jgi:hypothetical protein
VPINSRRARAILGGDGAARWKRQSKTDPPATPNLTHPQRVDGSVRGVQGGGAPLLGEPREACPGQAEA